MSLTTPSSHTQPLRMARVLIESRMQMVSAELKSAQAYGRYSQLAGFGGMRAALQEALELVEAQTGSDNARAGQVLVSTFMRRQGECDSARDEALTAERFEEVSALDGRGTGFLLALRIVQDEFQPARGNPAAVRYAPKRKPRSAG